MNRKELQSILESVKSGIASKDIVESMTYFFFSGKEIVTYNDKISIQHPLSTDFSLFVKANDLMKIVSKSSAEEIIMKEDSGKLKIKIGKAQGTLATITDEEVSTRISNVQKSLSTTKWKDLPENFIACILLCAFSASESESDQTLTCINIKGHSCSSTDNRRISNAILTSEIEDMLLKASEVNNLKGIAPTQYSVAKSWIHFRNEDNCVFSIRKVSGEFPDVLPHFDFEGSEITLPKDILEGLDITSIFADDSSPSVEILISANICTIRVSSDAGKISHKSKIKYKGEDISFRINPEFLKEMMKHSTTLTVCDTKIKLETENFATVTALFG
jgi:DNA polymerase III sliding clamp (beta) subunit (PCNA family)